MLYSFKKKCKKDLVDSDYVYHVFQIHHSPTLWYQGSGTPLCLPPAMDTTLSTPSVIPGAKIKLMTILNGAAKKWTLSNKRVHIFTHNSNVYMDKFTFLPMMEMFI